VSAAVVLAAGALIGLSLGALGGGGSILTVPVLVYGLGQAAAQATTGSLLVVGVTALVGAVTAYRSGNVLLTHQPLPLVRHPTHKENRPCADQSPARNAARPPGPAAASTSTRCWPGSPAAQRCAGHESDPAASGGRLRRLFGRG